MKQRLISSFFGIIILVLVLLGNQQVFDVVVTAISTMAVFEVINAVGIKNYREMKFAALLLPASLMLTSHFACAYQSAVIFVFISLFMLIMLFNHKNYDFTTTALFMAVSVMLSLSFLHVSMVRRLGNENIDVLIVLIGCWITDSCAYFSGYFFGKDGKHKLSPEISPKKTVEGSIGGIVGVVLILVAYAAVTANIMDMSVNYISLIAIGLISGVLSQLGDLCASVIKREHNIKDFGNIMPGHGGVMDRFDSFLFVAPAVYYVLKFFPVFI